jgi:hypothetical protein
MAGGMGRSAQGNLAQRLAAQAPPPALVHRSQARHCVVEGEPALLVEWRQGDLGWEGRVLSMTWIDAIGWATLERWLPASDIASA